VSIAGRSGQFDDEAVQKLLKLKEETPNMTTLCGLWSDQTEANFADMNLDPQDAKLLAPEKIAVNGSLTSLIIGDNALGADGFRVLLEGCKASSSLATLDLGNRIDWIEGRGYHFGSEGAKHAAELLRISGSLTSLDLSQNWMRAEGAIALAPAIAANGSLTKLSVKINFMGDEGKASIRQAVEGREGFVLEM
jgi:hypothetical protein